MKNMKYACDKKFLPKIIKLESITIAIALQLEVTRRHASLFPL